MPLGTKGDTQWLLEACHVCQLAQTRKCKYVGTPESKKSSIAYEVRRQYDREHGYTFPKHTLTLWRLFDPA